MCGLVDDRGIDERSRTLNMPFQNLRMTLTATVHQTTMRTVSLILRLSATTPIMHAAATDDHQTSAADIRMTSGIGRCGGFTSVGVYSDGIRLTVGVVLAGSFC